MPIKKSSLENKWYYRLAKVFFLLLGIIIALIILMGKRLYLCYTPAQFDLYLLIYVMVGLLLYYLLLIFAWRMLLYVIFGGMEDDTVKVGKDKTIVPSRGSVSDQWQTVILPLIILAVIIIIAFLASTGRIKTLKMFDSGNGNKINNVQNNSDKNRNLGSGCPATSAQTATPCHSISGGVGVSGVIVKENCPCPSDTIFRQMDNVTAGGPYRICECK